MPDIGRAFVKLSVLASVLSHAAVASAAVTAAFVDLDDSAIGAALGARLLTKADVSWVERADIDKVLQENRLQAMFSATGVGDRRAIGRLVAKITFDPAGMHQVRVFHEFRRSVDAVDPAAWRDAEGEFQPTFMATLAGPEPGTLRVFVGRKGRNFALNAHPLLIDPERETVDVLTHEFPDFESARDVTVYKDRLFYLNWSPGGIGLFRLGPPTWKPELLRRGLPQGELRIVDGRVHLIGKRWWSIELETELAKPVGAYVAASEVPWYFENRWSYPGQGGYAPARLQPEVERMSRSVYSNHYRLLVSSQRLRPGEEKFYQPLIQPAAKKN